MNHQIPPAVDDNSRDGSWLNQTLITLSQAARLFPSARTASIGTGPAANRSSVNPSTVYRWTTAGRMSRSGRLVRLSSCRIGGSNYTSVEAVEQFIRDLNDEGDDGPGPAALPIHTNRPPANAPTLQKQAEQAKAILKQRGRLE